jgi:hypothetical protein
MQEIERRNAVDVSQPMISIGLEVQAGYQVEQPTVRPIRDSDRQRFFVEVFDKPTDKTAKQAAYSALLRAVAAEHLDVLLEGSECSQAVVLLRKPVMQFVHDSLFGKRQKKLLVHTVSGGAAPL